jgi:biopolymer transport protein TolQ
MNDISMLSLLASASAGVKIVLFILLAMSIMSWGIILKKHFLLKKEEKAVKTFSDIFWKQKSAMDVYKNIRSKDIGFFGNSFKESIKFFYTTLKENPKTDKELLNEIISGNLQVALQKKERVLNQQISTLGTISSTSPYVGLLGTVYGILVAFWGLGWENGASIADIAPSIAEALIATGMGLFVAIPSLIAYNHFSNRINVLKQECMDIEDETINMNNKLFSSKSNRGNNGK